MVSTLLQKIAKAYAPGILAKKDMGNYKDLSIGDLVDYYEQEHHAVRSKKHSDIRVGTPATRLFSWAVRKGVPEPGKKHYAAQQPLHEHSYGSFEGMLPSGYGQGRVYSKVKGKALITNVDDTGITFVTAHGKYPERFRLQRMGEGKDWLLINVTPTKEVGLAKEHYTVVPKEDVKKLFTPENYIQAKTDGSAEIIHILGNKLESISYRTSKKTGRPIYHTERTDLYKEKNLKGLPNDSILKGELYGTKDNRVIPAAELGGILNASVANAILKKQEEGITLKHNMFDISRYKGKDITDKPYSERHELLKDIVKNLPPAFELAQSATKPKEQEALWNKIKSGKHPLTTEGIVAHPKGVDKPIKVKLTNEGKVVVVKILPGKGKYKNAAGSIYYALPEAPDKPIGRVSSGLSDEDRIDMIKNPDAWLGRTIRISSQEQFPSGAYRSPTFIARHEDYPEKEALESLPLPENEIDAPDVLQDDSVSCGVAAVQSVLGIYGIDVDGSDLKKELKTNEEGTNPPDIVRVFKSYNLRAYHVTLDVNRLKKLLEKQIPVILAIQAWPTKKGLDLSTTIDEGHYVLAIGYDNDKVYFEDPATLGYVYLTDKELNNRWRDVDGNNIGIAVMGDKKYDSGTAVSLSQKEQDYLNA